MVRRTDDTLRCSFCGKSQNEVKKLIAGPTVFICNKCIDICNEVITDDQLAAGEIDKNGAVEITARDYKSQRDKSMTAKHESADLILKLYDLRREETMRKARHWYIRQFHPENVQEVISEWRGEHSAYYRMVTSYWDMAASFVNHGAVDEQMFGDANPEHVAVFAKVEPFLDELRSLSGIPNYLHHLEQIVARSPGAKERTAQLRERFKQMAAMRAEAG